jgi:hypothetical protein
MSLPSSGLKSYPSKILAELATCFMLVSCLAYSFTLKVYAEYSSETSVDFQRKTRSYINYINSHVETGSSCVRSGIKYVSSCNIFVFKFFFFHFHNKKALL